jgi:hypothetical protein
LSDRKDKILETAVKLFNEKGCMKTSTRHIAEELGISVGNLYYYFKNKEDIIIDIYEKYMESISGYLTSIKDEIDAPFDYYALFSSQMELEKKCNFLRLEISNLYKTYPKVKEAIEKKVIEKAEELNHLFLHQIKYGYMIKLDKKELEFICSNTWVIGSQWELYWIFTKFENEKLRKLHGILNLLYLLKPYHTQKGLEESNLLNSITHIQKRIDNIT